MISALIIESTAGLSLLRHAYAWSFKISKRETTAAPRFMGEKPAFDNRERCARRENGISRSRFRETLRASSLTLTVRAHYLADLQVAINSLRWVDCWATGSRRRCAALCAS